MMVEASVTKTRPTAELEERPNTNPAPSMNVSQRQPHLRCSATQNNWSRDQSIPFRSADFSDPPIYLHRYQQICWWRWKWKWTVSIPRSRVADLTARSPSRNGASTAACQSPCTISCGRKVKHLQHSRSGVIRQLRLKPTPLGRASARPKRMLKKRPEMYGLHSR
jgi:hypothetical protein